MIFRQLIDPETSTYTYLLGDESAREAVLIDPVLEQLDRDCTLLEEMGLELRFTLETHVHADHVTASGRLRERLGSQIAVGARAGVRNADLSLEDGGVVRVADLRLEVVETPGHTAGCVTYVCSDGSMAFTGDALLVRGCGRTDFQDGDADTLFRSVRERIFALPDSYLLYPGHDYKGRTVTAVAEEKRCNPRLGLHRSREEFLSLMAGLSLAYPKRLDTAVPANLESGLMPFASGNGSREAAPGGPVAQAMERAGRQDAELWLGMGI